MKFLKRTKFTSIVLLVVIGGLFFIYAKDKYVVPVMVYHQISTPESKHQLNLVSPQSFARQMNFLKKNGYEVMSVGDLMEGIQNARPFKRNSVVITFDDGFVDNYSEAFPILQKHGFPAMVFMVADFAGTRGYLTWEQLKMMETGGFQVGGHTRRHPYLPDVKDEARLSDEIVNGKIIIETYLGKPIEFFAYPHGGFSDPIIDVVKKAGYKGAFSTNRGRNRLNKNVYELNRIRIKDGDNNFKLLVKLSGYYNLFRKSKNPY